jgi:hypothetical protein
MGSGFAYWDWNPRDLIDSWRITRNSKFWQTQRLPTFCKEFFELTASGSPIDSANFMALYQQDIAGNSRHLEPLDDIVFLVDINVTDKPTGCTDFSNERCHLLTGATPVR